MIQNNILNFNEHLKSFSVSMLPHYYTIIINFWLHCAARGISVSQPGAEPAPQQRKPGILTSRPSGNSQNFNSLFFFFGCTGSFLLCVWAFSSHASRVYSSWQCDSFSLWWLLLLPSTGSEASWLQQLWHVGSVAAVQGSRGQAQLWRISLVVRQHMESSQTRDQTRVPCTGRRILNHWTTREILNRET